MIVFVLRHRIFPQKRRRSSPKYERIGLFSLAAEGLRRKVARMARVEKPVRKPQARSVATHARLLEATITSLTELGWAGATMAVIAERAGVSRGASQHHFRTRDELVTAAVLHMSHVRSEEIRGKKARIERGPRRTFAVLTLLSSFYLGPLFAAAVQLWVGAVSDARLRGLVAPLEAHVGRQAHQLAVELLGADESVPGVRETVQGTLDLLRGLGLADLLRDDGMRRKKILRAWADTLDRVLPASLPDRGPPAGRRKASSA